MKAQKSIIKVQREYIQDFIAPKTEFENVKTAFSIARLAKKYKKCIFVDDIFSLKNTYDTLKKIGFEGQFKGRSLPAGTLLKMAGPNFSYEEQITFFKTMFDKDSVIPEAIDAHNGTQAIAFIDDAGTAHNKPTIDDSICICITCKQRRPAYTVFARTNDQSTFCSSSCCITKIIQAKISDTPSLEILQNTKPLAKDEIQLLRQMAALCYYQYLVLSPTVTDENLFFYHVPHGALSHYLTKLQTSLKRENLLRLILGKTHLPILSPSRSILKT